jgi:hypothetical protein
MKISLTNENRIQLTLNKYEYVLICATDNKNMLPEYHYDLNEIISDEREEFVITQDDLDENENGFVMWSDTFWDTIREFAGHDDVQEIDIPVTLNIHTNASIFNGLTFHFRRYNSDDLCPKTYTPWETWICGPNDTIRIPVLHDDIGCAKRYARNVIAKNPELEPYRQDGLMNVYSFKNTL